MRSLCSRLLGEPILHFTGIGAALFLLHAAVAPIRLDAVVEDDRRVVIGAERVAGLVESWTQAWGRPPTAEELDLVIEEEVRAEVLAREAQRQGLDRGDEFIRQHLRERMEVIADHGGGDLGEPSEADLRAFHAANEARYGSGTAFSFTQVALDPARHGASLEADAAALLARLQRGDPLADPASLGEIADLPATFAALTEPEVEELLGPEFGAALAKLATGRWAGPFASSRGLHLVRVDERAARPGPPFDELRETLREEWLAERTQERRDRFYRELRQRFTVIVERGEPRLAASGP